MGFIEHGHSARAAARELGTTVHAVYSARARFDLPAARSILLSPNRIAGLLGIDHQRVQRWIRDGYLPGRLVETGVKHVQMTSVDWDDLYNFMQNSLYWHLWGVETIADQRWKSIAIEARRQPSQWLSAEEVAARHFACVTAARKWAADGLIEARKIMYEWRFSRASVESFELPRVGGKRRKEQSCV